MYCRGHRQANPLVSKPRLRTPRKFLAPLVESPARLQAEVAGYKTIFLNEFLHRKGLEPWLHSYGIGATGYTFMERGSYQRNVEQQLKLDPKMLKRMLLPCDGLLLVSRKNYSPLWGILSLDKEIQLSTTLAENFSKDVGGDDKKILAVLHQLKRELHALAEESGITIGDKLPAVFKPTTTGKGSMPQKPRGKGKLRRQRVSPKGTLSGHYKAGSYDVYPLWLGAGNES